MANVNPADASQREEHAIAAAFAAFFVRLAKIPLAAAIRSGSIKSIIGSSAYAAALEKVFSDVRKALESTFASGMRSGLAEVPGTALRGIVPALAREDALLRAAGLVQAVDARTKRAISRMARSASIAYAKEPSLGRLRSLSAEIRPLIGLTPWQSSLLRRRAGVLRASGVAEAEVVRQLREAASRKIALRASQIADRTVVEAVSAGRSQAWLEAREAGEISDNAMKRWQDQGDAGVRPKHRAQTLAGPIPLDAIYSIQRVLHPPSNDMGCRCWEVLFTPPEGLISPDQPRATSTPESRQRRAEELLRRRAQYEKRRKALEAAADQRNRRVSLDPRTPTTPGERYKAKVQSAWVHGSRGKTSVHTQEAVRREFNIEPAVWNRRGHAIDSAVVSSYRDTARSLYESTQASLKASGVSSVRVYRGVKDASVKPGAGTLESWTTEPLIAQKFAGPGGEVYSRTISAEDVFLYSGGPNWKNGRFGEQFEWVIMGRRK